MKEQMNNDNDNNRTLCTICLTNPKNMLFLPCKHLCACSECANQIVKRTNALNDGSKPLCPICRAPAQTILDVYA